MEAKKGPRAWTPRGCWQWGREEAWEGWPCTKNMGLPLDSLNLQLETPEIPECWDFPRDGKEGAGSGSQGSGPPCWKHICVQILTLSLTTLHPGVSFSLLWLSTPLSSYLQAFVLIFLIFFFLMAAPAAYVGSQARGWIRTTWSKSHLQPMPQFAAMPDP